MLYLAEFYLPEETNVASLAQLPRRNTAGVTDSPGKKRGAIGAFIVCVPDGSIGGLPGARRAGPALQRLPRTTGSASTVGTYTEQVRRS
jgi:hypothetical protein